MGLTIAGAGVSAAISLFSPVGLGVGGIFVAAALVFLLAYIHLHPRLRPNRRTSGPH